MLWLFGLLKHNPERLLNLLLRAHFLDVEEASVKAAFRAGLKVGRKYPEYADQVLNEGGPEWEI